MAHPSVVINGVTYQNVPEVDIPISGGGTAKFYDVTNVDAAAANVGFNFLTRIHALIISIHWISFR